MRRVLLLAVAGFLSASALLAVGVLLFGDFGETEGKILATTALIAGFGLLALPAAILLDQGRLRRLAAAVAALAALGAGLTIATVWSDGNPAALAETATTAVFCLGATTQTAALAARRRDRDPRAVRILFPASAALAATVAAIFATIVWAEIDSPDLGRVVGALVVLDVLAVALQPILARARAAETSVHLQLHVESGETVDLTVDAADLAAAAARAIRTTERSGRRVSGVEVLERHGV